MNNERWLTCAPGYEVSDSGCVRSLARAVRCRGGSRTISGCMLKPFIVSSTGYQQVMIARKKLSVHRLVAFAFCAGHATGLVVNHKDGNRTNNNAANLEWVTHGENMRHAFRALGAKRSALGKFGGEHAASKSVVSTDIKTGAVKFYASAMDAVRDGFDSSCISRCCQGLNRWHKGRHWAFGVEHNVTFGEPERRAA